MRGHLAYLRYVLRHKWFVMLACLGGRASLWRGLLHDLSKFLPSEWSAYVHTFYKPDGSKRYVETNDFALAWNHHQKRNRHHWQYWLLTWDRGETVALKMPERYTREMVADWRGAGRAISGSRDPAGWYLKNRDKIMLHPETRALVERLLRVAVP